jgi:4-hydroxythreonine-4-phosphate dehydrogenase
MTETEYASGVFETLPVVGVTVGDPAGIGPEIAVRALCEPSLYKLARPLLIGPVTAVEQGLTLCGARQELAKPRTPRRAAFHPSVVNVIEPDGLDLGRYVIGQIQSECGRAAFASIETAVALATAGEIDAIATAPIHKGALKAAGLTHLGVGHTEIFAALAGVGDPLTMFQVETGRGCLRVFFYSRHVSLRRAIELVQAGPLAAFIRRCHAALCALGLPEPRLAVAGLNPHSSDGGLFGDEEALQITPAVNEVHQDDLAVVGPIPADSVFHLAMTGHYDAVVSLFHDQGHIATKTLDFERTVSVTLGLPFLRTSVDHGTAFDIAGLGRASAVSMIEAIKTAARYSGRHPR